MDWNYCAPFMINSFCVEKVIEVQISLRSLQAVIVV
jgi:hypothetical protein